MYIYTFCHISTKNKPFFYFFANKFADIIFFV